MLTLTDQNFEKEISNAQKPILVDFWAFWCIPCRLITPILEKLAKEYENEIILAKANLDTAPIIAQKYGIDRIPMLIIFKDGKPISGFIGVRPEPIIKEWIENTLKENKDEKN